MRAIRRLEGKHETKYCIPTVEDNLGKNTLNRFNFEHEKVVIVRWFKTGIAMVWDGMMLH